jgi:hypothetical protein
MQNFCSGRECTISSYKSCKKCFVTKAYTLLQLSQIHWECFAAFRKPSECKIMQNLCFGPECTILGCQSCKKCFVTKASILLQWTQNDGREILGAFCRTSKCKMMRNLCFRPKCTIFGVLDLRSIHSTTLDLKWCLELYRSIPLTYST